MRITKLPLLLLSLFLVSTVHAEDYKIDDHQNGAHAFVQFKASHLGYSYVIGQFDEFTGQFSYDEEAPESSTVSVEIKTSSLDSNHAERDQHLKSADFLDAGTYPTITFKSTQFEEQADGRVAITGNLTFHGVTKLVTLHGRHIGHGKDPWGGYRRGLEASVDLDASEFGLPSWVGMVQVDVVVEGIRS